MTALGFFFVPEGDLLLLWGSQSKDGVWGGGASAATGAGRPAERAGQLSGRIQQHQKASESKGTTSRRHEEEKHTFLPFLLYWLLILGPLQSEELQAVRQQTAQDARSRQQLDLYRAQTLEQIRAEVEDRERQLQMLREELDRGSRMHRLERQRSAKQIQQVWSPLLK